MRRPGSALLVLLLGSLCACGQEGAREAAPCGPVPATPELALAWVREAAAADDAGLLRTRLAAWPVDAQAFRRAEETRVALTWRVRLALQAGDVAAAVGDHALLGERFQGEGLSPEGRRLSAQVMRAGIFEEALARGRQRIEGTRPDPDGARRALAAAASLLEPTGPTHFREWARLEVIRRWVELDSVDDPILVRLGMRRARPTTPQGPWVLVFADDFTLGDAVFAGVLQRWQREGRPHGLGVFVVPLLRGQVRMGQRLVPAESEEEERASLRARCAQIGLTLSAELFERVASSELASWWGLGPQDVAILVLDTEGRVVGRLSGSHLDPRPLDPIVQKLISR